MFSIEGLEQNANSDWLRSAIRVANVPTLACLLVQLTGDIRWIEGRFVPVRTRGLDDNEDGGLPLDVQEEIRSAAIEAVEAWLAGKPPALEDPDDALLCRIMGVSLGEEIPLDYAPMIRQELRLPNRSDPLPSVQVPDDFLAIIIGAGISGLCAALEFRKAGIPYIILERNDRPGGVWLENRYPGAACDVPSHLYSFSFAPGDWSRYFAGSREIQSYLEAFAADQDIVPNIRFREEVVEARYRDDEAYWEVDAISDGVTRTYRGKIIVSCVGAFNKPRLPSIPGMETFMGPSVHTARYPDEGLALAGKDVVLVGNGASAMQVAPAIAGEVKSLTVVLRTPQWVAPFPKFGQSIPDDLRRLLREVEPYRLWYRLRLSWAFNDKQHGSLQIDPDWTSRTDSINALNDAHRRGLTAYMQQELGDAQHLLPSVIPDYPPFGKRMLLDNGWFRTLAKPNVTSVNGSVVEVRPVGVVTSDGAEHKADVLIWATGFDVVNLLAPMNVRGRGGQILHREWQGDDARAYLGTVVPGFPNFFCLYGPNTQFGHGGSLISVLERQMHYVMSLLLQMFDDGIAVVDVRRDVYENYNQRVDDAHAKMIWSRPDLNGYYKNSKGRIVVNNPFRIIDVWKMTERANIADYEVVETIDAQDRGLMTHKA
ncbi:flavin-containing monooxygenase [Sphingomonas sp. ID0503]|uniref:flavin-containing monooxygenase n=1 Tax=Sphingomonas sp. ID0503 TaxID=3399691 RepID=UPI003AFA14C6